MRTRFLTTIRNGGAGSPRLSPRERECLGFAARGMTSADIGIKLAITERTVNFHFGNIIAKLRVLNRGEAIARAVSLELVSVAL
jgi:DNA-binding CsgD family transcriptional regulator